MPYVKFPTRSDGLDNGDLEGGVIAPFAVALPDEFGHGIDDRGGHHEDGDGSGHHPEFVNTVTFAGAYAGHWEVTWNSFQLLSKEDDSGWVGTVDCRIYLRRDGRIFSSTPASISA